MMAVLSQCFCYSLRHGSFIIGSYALIVYCVAFAVELWWIVESAASLPAPSYTLCALYFFNFIMAAVLLFGLLIRQRKYLMSWTLMTVVGFFPEAGMVLFMSLYYWPSAKAEYGVIELIFWSLRAIFNILGSVCVCSLYLTWRDEELILDRLHDLTLANVESLSSSPAVAIMRQGTLSHPLHPQHTHLHSTLNNSKAPLAYHNLGYLDTHSTGPLTFGGSRTHLNTSSVTSPAFSSPANQLRASLLRMKSEFNPALLFDPQYQLRKTRDQISQLGIAGIGLEPPPPQIQRSRSLWNVSNDDYWARPPPSRPVSMGYVNYTHQQQQDYLQNQQKYPHYPGGVGVGTVSRQGSYYRPGSTLTLHNFPGQGQGHPHNYNQTMKSQLVQSYLSHLGGGQKGQEGLSQLGFGRRAQSMDALNQGQGGPGQQNQLFYQRYYGQNIVACGQGLGGWSRSKSDVSVEEEDDVRSYQDIPL